MSSFLRRMSNSFSPNAKDEAKAIEKEEEEEEEEFGPAVFVAGASMQEIEAPTERDLLAAAEGVWSQCDESSFLLRVGPNYAKTGAKEPSPSALFDLVGIDFLRSNTRIKNIGKKVKFPSDWTDGYGSSDDEDGDGDGEGEGDDDVHIGGGHHVPTMLIVNTQFPKDFNTSLFSEAPTDGEGWNLVHYFRIKKSVREELKDLEKASPAVKLLARFCEEAPAGYTDSSSTWHGRFKLVTRCENIEEFGLPSFITSYNAKPVLIRNTSTMYSSSSIEGKEGSCSYLEIDLNVHKFGSVPKKALATMIDKFSSMRVSSGFCIESQEDDEMPETMLGVSTTYKPDHSKAMQWEEVCK